MMTTAAVTLFYLAFALVAFSSFGSAIKPNVLDSLPSLTLARWVKTLMCASLMCSLPLFNDAVFTVMGVEVEEANKSLSRQTSRVGLVRNLSGALGSGSPLVKSEVLVNVVGEDLRGPGTRKRETGGSSARATGKIDSPLPPAPDLMRKEHNQGNYHFNGQSPLAATLLSPGASPRPERGRRERRHLETRDKDRDRDRDLSPSRSASASKSQSLSGSRTVSVNYVTAPPADIPPTAPVFEPVFSPHSPGLRAPPASPAVPTRLATVPTRAPSLTPQEEPKTKISSHHVIKGRRERDREKDQIDRAAAESSLAESESEQHTTVIKALLLLFSSCLSVLLGDVYVEVLVLTGSYGMTLLALILPSLFHLQFVRQARSKRKFLRANADDHDAELLRTQSVYEATEHSFWYSAKYCSSRALLSSFTLCFGILQLFFSTIVYFYEVIAYVNSDPQALCSA
jgi:hypothetical protein